MVRVGSASINEKGTINGGQPGDQTGRECKIQNWYLHSRGWYIIRAKDARQREKIAHNMESICNNNNIGYCQNHRSTLTTAAQPYGYDASKVKVKVETDCSEAVRNCCLYAGINVLSFSTATEVNALKNTGLFDIITDSRANTSEYLKRGDILVTRRKGHTVVVLDNGSKAGQSKPSSGSSGGKKKNHNVVNLQKALNKDGIRDARGRRLEEDGIIGANTRYAASKVLISRNTYGKKKNITRWVQTMVGTNADGWYGKNTKAAVIKFQKSHGLTPDGVVGKNTMAELLRSC